VGVGGDGRIGDGAEDVSEDAFCALFQLPLQGATAATAGRRLAVHEERRRPVGHGRTGGGGGEGEGYWFSRQRRRRGYNMIYFSTFFTVLRKTADLKLKCTENMSYYIICSQHRFTHLESKGPISHLEKEGSE
jgi:hypothetical protein